MKRPYPQEYKYPEFIRKANIDLCFPSHSYKYPCLFGFTDGRDGVPCREQRQPADGDQEAGIPQGLGQHRKRVPPRAGMPY